MTFPLISKVLCPRLYKSWRWFFIAVSLIGPPATYELVPPVVDGRSLFFPQMFRNILRVSNPPHFNHCMNKSHCHSGRYPVLFSWP